MMICDEIFIKKKELQNVMKLRSVMVVYTRLLMKCFID